MSSNFSSNAGTGSINVAPPYLTEQDSTGFSDFQSITLHHAHCDKSFEELRLNDYALGQGVVVRPFTPWSLEPPPGLVKASIPFGRSSSRILLSKASVAPGTNPYCSRAIFCRVGEEDLRDFVVHEDLITASSEFARAALKKEWKEDREGLLPLPEDDVISFELYHQWLYTGEVFLNRLAKSFEPQDHYEVLVKAYLLGQKLIDHQFKDTTVDCIVDKLRSERAFDPCLTNLIYENTPTESPLRNLWLDVYVHSGNPSWLDEKAIGDVVNAEFLLDLSKVQMRIVNRYPLGDPAFMSDSCFYHEHPAGRCYRA